MVYNPNLYKDQSKRNRTPYWGQVQRWVFKAKTKEEWIDLFNNKLTPKEQWDILKAYTPVPKEITNENNGLQIVLQLNGVDIKPIQARTVRAIEPHDNDADSE
jgi:hypothetical protein